MLPVELYREQHGAEACIDLQINADLPWFEGHFPETPILPGVAQLDWVMHYTCMLLAPGYQFAAVENMKFQQPVQPGERLSLRLSWQAEKQQVSFSYLRYGTQHAVSSGKVTLCR